MTYEDCQALFAKYGFIETPLNEEQFQELVGSKASDLEIYGVGCDVYCGVPFNVAKEANL